MDHRITNMQSIKAFLTENNIKYVENAILKKADGMKADLFIPKLRITIHISDEMDLEFYKATYRPYHPFFVRSTETKEFTLEKIQNCIIDAMKFQQKMYNKRSEARKREEG